MRETMGKYTTTCGEPMGEYTTCGEPMGEYASSVWTYGLKFHLWEALGGFHLWGNLGENFTCGKQ